MTLPGNRDAALERTSRRLAEQNSPVPLSLPAHPLIRLQKQAGNAAVARIVQRLQANQVQRVVQLEEGEDDLQAKHDPSLQQAGNEDERGAGGPDDANSAATVGLAGGSMPDEAAARIDSVRGTGSTLSDSVRSAAESTLGADLSAVRVHQDAASDSLARRMTAKAFTSGTDVFLRKDVNANDSRLMGHELTHVVQQSSGEPSPTGQRLTVGAADDPLEHEAEAVATSISNGSANREMEDG